MLTTTEHCQQSSLPSAGYSCEATVKLPSSTDYSLIQFRITQHSYLAKVDLPDPGAPRSSTRTFPSRRSLLYWAGG